uniref:Transmembrane protein n=1 Tax=Knipowitschia caucasica TaxID=637954 RepID=A0AAV2LXV1_KNICA
MGTGVGVKGCWLMGGCSVVGFGWGWGMGVVGGGGRGAWVFVCLVYGEWGVIVKVVGDWVGGIGSEVMKVELTEEEEEDNALK